MIVKRAAALAALFALMIPAAARAQVQVSGAWARATVPGQSGTGAYMTLRATELMRVVGASSSAAGVVEIHEMSMDGGVMRMRAIEVLDLPANKAVLLRPGGHHMMLMDLKRPLKVGTKVAIELQLEKPSGERSAQRVELDVYNAPPPAR